MDDNCSLKLGRSEGRVVERTITPLAPLRLLLLLLLLLLVLTGMVVCMVRWTFSGGWLFKIQVVGSSRFGAFVFVINGDAGTSGNPPCLWMTIDVLSGEVSLPFLLTTVTENDSLKSFAIVSFDAIVVIKRPTTANRGNVGQTAAQISFFFFLPTLVRPFQTFDLTAGASLWVKKSHTKDGGDLFHRPTFGSYNRVKLSSFSDSSAVQVFYCWIKHWKHSLCKKLQSDPT